MNGLSVKVDHILKVGQLVKLIVKASDEVSDRERAESSENEDLLVYVTRIEDLVSDNLLVSWPTDQGVRIPAFAGQSVSLEIKCQHGVLYLDSKISAFRNSPVPLLHISRMGDWSRSQLRSNVRLEVTITPHEATLLPVRAEDLQHHEGSNHGSNGNGAIDVDALKKFLAKSEAEGSKFRALISDLSAGGVLLLSAIRLEKGSIIRIRFPLGKGQPDISALGLVVRFVEGESGNKEYPHRAGCKFLDLSMRDEDNTIRFIFARQAELRRSGML